MVGQCLSKLKWVSMFVALLIALRLLSMFGLGPVQSHLDFPNDTPPKSFGKKLGFFELKVFKNLEIIKNHLIQHPLNASPDANLYSLNAHPNGHFFFQQQPVSLV